MIRNFKLHLKYYLKIISLKEFRDLFFIGPLVGLKIIFSFIKGNIYRFWDNWSLTPLGILWIMDLITSKSINNIIEFGSGISTVVLSEFIKLTKSKNLIDSYEHQQLYDSALADFCYPENVVIHLCKLKQLTGISFDELATSEDPLSKFLDNSIEVPIENYSETRLLNSFYDYNFDNLKTKKIDLIVLDGPNGNGRSICFPLLKYVINYPCYLIIDDYLDYPFMDDLGKVFKFNILKHVEKEEKEYILISINSRIDIE